MRTNVFGLLIVLLSGCASGGTGNGSETVPVYLEERDVPCDYEVIQTLRETVSVNWTNSRERERARDEALGRAGARLGADFVFVPKSLNPGVSRIAVPTAPVTTRAPTPARPPPVTFEGLAVRCVYPNRSPGSLTEIPNNSPGVYGRTSSF